MNLINKNNNELFDSYPTDKTFWFYISSGYHSETSIYANDKPPISKFYNSEYSEKKSIKNTIVEYVKDEDDSDNEEFVDFADFKDVESVETSENAPEFSCEITFELPKDGFRVYIVNEFPNYCRYSKVDIS